MMIEPRGKTTASGGAVRATSQLLPLDFPSSPRGKLGRWKKAIYLHTGFTFHALLKHALPYTPIPVSSEGKEPQLLVERQGTKVSRPPLTKIHSS